MLFLISSSETLFNSCIGLLFQFRVPVLLIWFKSLSPQWYVDLLESSVSTNQPFFKVLRKVTFSNFLTVLVVQGKTHYYELFANSNLMNAPLFIPTHQAIALIPQHVFQPSGDYRQTKIKHLTNRGVWTWRRTEFTTPFEKTQDTIFRDFWEFSFSNFLLYR